MRSDHLERVIKTLPPIDLGHFAATAATRCPSVPSIQNANKYFTFTYAELFAGMGGFRVALDKLGGQCVFASEIDRFCVKNYEQNFGGDRPAGDICRICSKDIPNHDLLVGGFPCQPFSSSGSKEGMKDAKGVLFREIARILRDKQPKAFLLENVRGLLLHENGSTFDVIKKELECSGYKLSCEVVDAVMLLPQERKRLYIGGVRQDLKVNEQYAFPSLPNLQRGVADILHNNNSSDKLSEEEVQKLTLSDHQLSKVRSQTYTKQHPEARFLGDLSKPSKTIQSSYASYMVGSQFVPANPIDNQSGQIISQVSLADINDNEMKWRRFSCREAARLQGFPESFQLCPQRAYHMIGNAVAPPIIAMIAAPLLQLIELATSEDENWGWVIATEILLEAVPNDDRRTHLERRMSSTQYDSFDDS